ncbi:MAG: Holliday junction branch migration protein RuvA [Rikenellaceae bacterium]
MYEYITGGVAELTATNAIIEAAGVGYFINISLNTFSKLEGADDAKLYIHYIVREDAQILYGFSTKEERDIFRLLISVSGVGGNTARMVLSTYSPAELRGIINTENAVMLKSVKGLGLKTAQKIIVELSGKMIGLEGDITEVTAPQSGSQSEALEALVMLGFSKSQCQKVVADIVKSSPSSSVEEVIRLALKRL